MDLQKSITSPLDRFVNLRHSGFAGPSLSAIGIPRSYAYGDVKPFATYVNSDSSRVEIAYNDTELFRINSDGTPVLIARLPSPPLATVPLCGSEYMIYCESDTCKIDFDKVADEVVNLAENSFPRLTILPRSAETVSAQVPAFALSRAYTAHDVKLDFRDLFYASRNVIDAASRLRSEASGLGLLVNPVIARYKYFDSEGRLLFAGPPTLVVPSEWALPESPMKFSFTTGSSEIPAATVSHPVFRLALDGDNSVARNDIEWVTIEATTQIEPLNFTGICSSSFTRDASGNMTLTLNYPGLSTPDAYRQRVMAAVNRLDKLYTTVAKIHRPFDGSGSMPELYASDPASGTPEKRAGLLEKILSAPVDAGVDVKSRFEPPHTFTATEVSKNGGSILLANPAALLFKGYSPDFFASEFTAGGDWTAKAEVTFSDGRSVSAFSRGSGRVPLRLSPLISYPSVSAVAVSFRLSSGGKLYGADIDLAPAIAGGMAYYIGDVTKGIQLTEVDGDSDIDYSDSLHSRVTIACPGTLLSCRASDPWNPVSVNAGDGAVVTALCPVPSANRGLEQRRNRFYAFSTSGTKIATLDDKGSILNVSVVDTRPVTDRRRVVPDPSGAVLALAAPASLLRFAGTSCTLLDAACPGKGLAVDAVRNELWIYGDDASSIHVRDMTRGDYYVRQMEFPVSANLSASDGSRIRMGYRLCRLGDDESADGSTYISATIHLTPEKRTKNDPKVVRAVVVDFYNPVEAEVRIGAVPANTGWLPVSPIWRTATVRRNSFVSNIRFPVVLAPRPKMIVSVDGNVTPGALFNNVNLEYYER